MTSELSDLLAQPKELNFLGAKLTFFALDFNDLAMMETEFGTLDSFDLGSAEVSRLICWLALRKADPGLSAEDRKACRYKLTREDVGRMMPVKKKERVGAFLESYLQFSGLAETEEEKADSGNE